MKEDFRKESRMSTKKTSRRRLRWFVIGAFLFIAGGAVLYLYAGNREQPAQEPQFTTYTV
jgi:hypothetical protein